MLQKLHSFLLQKLRGRHYIFYSWGLNSTAFQFGTWGSSCSIWWHCNEAEECQCLLCIRYPSPPVQGRGPATGPLLTKTPAKERALKISLKDNHSKKKKRIISQVNKKLFGWWNAGFKLVSEKVLETVLYTWLRQCTRDSLPTGSIFGKRAIMAS